MNQKRQHQYIIRFVTNGFVTTREGEMLIKQALADMAKRFEIHHVSYCEGPPGPPLEEVLAAQERLRR